MIPSITAAPRDIPRSGAADEMASTQVISTSGPVSTGHFGHGQQFCFARKRPACS